MTTTTDTNDPKIAPEILELIDNLVAQIVARFEATGDGPAALASEREARKIIHDRCPKGRRAVAKKELYARFMSGVSPICAKMVREDIAADRRLRELQKQGLAR